MPDMKYGMKTSGSNMAVAEGKIGLLKNFRWRPFLETGSDYGKTLEEHLGAYSHHECERKNFENGDSRMKGYL